MSLSKLKTIHVVIIGCFACVMVGFGLGFLLIKKSYDRIGELNGKYQALEQEYQKKASVEARLEAASQKSRLLQVKYNKYLKEKMPPISFQDRAQGMIALWKEQSEVLGPLLRSWPDRTGVTLNSGVKVPAAPVDPNSIDVSLITIPIGTFSVKGDFSTLLSHLRSWNKFNRLVKIDPGRLTGPSPTMTVDYTVTVYIFPRGEAGQTIAMAGAGEGGQAGAPGRQPMPMPSPGAGPESYTPEAGMPAPSM